MSGQTPEPEQAEAGSIWRALYTLILVVCWLVFFLLWMVEPDLSGRSFLREHWGFGLSLVLGSAFYLIILNDSQREAEDE